MLVKANSIELLQKGLARKRVKGTSGLGSMNDCYMPLEREINRTGRAPELIAQFGFTVHVMTNSDLDTLCEINRRYATVSFTVTTADDELGKKLEPGASPVSDRFRAMRIIAAIVEMAHDHGASYIVPSFGMSLRDRQRAYYYDRLDELFPGLRVKYERMYGDRCHCPVPNADRLTQVFGQLCDR